MSAARTTYETLLVELDRGVALVTLNRPDWPAIAEELPW